MRAQIPQLQQQESEYINALCFLLDQSPGALRGIVGSQSLVRTGPPRIPLGIPSELARRRPDIRAAEDQLHAATANIGVAVGDFYPSVQLNGTIGFDALNVSNLYKPNSLQYNFGPSVSLPIFQGGRLRSTLQLRGAQQEEAAIAYRKTVLQAWHDVVNALVAHRLEMVRRARLRAESDHARAALDLARARYNDGVSEFLTGARRRADFAAGRSAIRRQHHQCRARPRATVQGAGRRLGNQFSRRAVGDRRGAGAGRYGRRGVHRTASAIATRIDCAGLPVQWDGRALHPKHDHFLLGHLPHV